MKAQPIEATSTLADRFELAKANADEAKTALALIEEELREFADIEFAESDKNGEEATTVCVKGAQFTAVVTRRAASKKLTLKDYETQTDRLGLVACELLFEEIEERKVVNPTKLEAALKMAGLDPKRFIAVKRHHKIRKDYFRYRSTLPNREDVAQQESAFLAAYTVARPKGAK